MHIKNWQYYFIIGIPAVIILIYFFCPLFPTTSTNNETIFSSMFGWKFNDGSVFVALLTSIITILVTHYSVNKNFKSVKLSSLPHNSVNLLIDLEFKFDKYKTCEDEFILLTEILKDWKEHQKAFKLLTPKFYSEFLRTINKFMNENTISPDINEKELHKEEMDDKHIEEKDEESNNNTGNTTEKEEYNKPTKNQINTEEHNDQEKTSEDEIDKTTKNEKTDEEPKNKWNYGNENSKYILKALLVQIEKIAFENEARAFEFIKPKLITDANIQEIEEDLENYTKIKITTTELKGYIEEISGNSTCKFTNEKFETFKDEIKKLIDTLKKEIEEYD